MRKMLALIIYLVTTLLVGIANAEFRVGGYYKNFSTVFNSPLPDASMTGIVVNRLRFNLSYARQRTHFRLLLPTILCRAFKTLYSFLSLLIAVGAASSRYRITDFDSH